jgi:hypothetical protein
LWIIQHQQVYHRVLTGEATSTVTCNIRHSFVFSTLCIGSSVKLSKGVKEAASPFNCRGSPLTSSKCLVSKPSPTHTQTPTHNIGHSFSTPSPHLQQKKLLLEASSFLCHNFHPRFDQHLLPLTTLTPHHHPPPLLRRCGRGHSLSFVINTHLHLSYGLISPSNWRTFKLTLPNASGIVSRSSSSSLNFCYRSTTTTQYARRTASC